MPDWREPKTRAFSLYPEPGDFSTDNGVLFTVVAHKLGLITNGECELIIATYEDPRVPGILLRHPSAPGNYCSWDDHLAACVASPVFAERCLKAFRFSGWRLPDGNFVGRIPILPTVVRAGTLADLSAWNQLIAAGVYLANSFEAREETSGKQLLWLAQSVLRGYPALDKVRTFWRARLLAKYPHGLREMLGIYYTNAEHPFLAAAGKSFLCT